MPRRKVQPEQFLDNGPVLALPPVRPSGGHHKHEHEIDAYQLPPGAVPGKISNLEIKTRPKEKVSAKDLAERDAIRAEMRVKAKRYNEYLDLMAENGGNQLASLCAVYGIDAEEASERFEELRMDVRQGIGSTDIGRIMEKNDLDIHARARVLKKWLYSNEPGPSLKALDMVNDISDDSNTTGSFETFLRLAKSSSV